MNDDQDFIRNLYAWIMWIWAAAVTCALVLQKPWIALSITFGTAVSAGTLALFDCVVRRTFGSGSGRPKHTLWKLVFVKYPLLAGILYWLVRWDRISLAAFCGGVLLVHLAIVAKTVGDMVAEHRRTPGIGVQDKET